MKPFNYHTHTTFSDGKADPEKNVREAIRRGMTSLGFSDHAPLPFETKWTISKNRIQEYCRTISDLKARYSESIKIYLGLEIDFIPELCEERKRFFEGLNLDYHIGSIHFAGTFADARLWIIDSGMGKFDEGLKEIYHGDIRLAVENYFARTRKMVEDDCPDIIGHMDLIKLRGAAYFSEDEEWYRNAVLKTLETIAASKAIVEVNTGGISKGKIDSTYPSVWVLKHCREMNIPVTFSADAHSPEFLSGGFNDVIEMLRRIGYLEISRLADCGWNSDKI